MKETIAALHYSNAFHHQNIVTGFHKEEGKKKKKKAAISFPLTIN